MVFTLLAAECQGRPLPDIHSAATQQRNRLDRQIVLLQYNTKLQPQYGQRLKRLPRWPIWCY